MDSEAARLVQYRVMADHRLHFGRLYFQVIGINLAVVAVTATAIGVAKPAWWMAMRMLAGLVMVGTGFVAHRLHLQEERYASVLRAIEEEGGMIQLPGTQRHGARRSVVIGLVAAGLCLSIEALVRMLPL